MKVFVIVAFLVLPLLLGLIIRIIFRNKPATELVILGILMCFVLFFFIYGIVQVTQQETKLFTRNHLSNEFTVISSSIFLILGFFYYRNIRRDLKLKSKDDRQDNSIGT